LMLGDLPRCMYCGEMMQRTEHGHFGCSRCRDKHLLTGKDEARAEFREWLVKRLAIVDAALGGK
jgi:tRNA(Ile2) C34 agmatinyltransferase TiaS